MSDPFNFNDIYAQMGANNLVKKPMRGAATPSPPAATATRTPASAAVVTTGASGCVSHSGPRPDVISVGAAGQKIQATTSSAAAAYDLDFLGSAGKGPSTAPAAAPSSSAPRPAPAVSVVSAAKGAAAAPVPAATLGFDDFFEATPASQQAPSSPPPAQQHAAASTSDAGDPFAAFEAIDGAMPVISNPVSPAATPVASSGDLLNLGEASAAGPAPAPKAAPAPYATAQPEAPFPSYPAVPYATAADKESDGYPSGSAPAPNSSVRPDSDWAHEAPLEHRPAAYGRGDGPPQQQRQQQQQQQQQPVREPYRLSCDGPHPTAGSAASQHDRLPVSRHAAGADGAAPGGAQPTHKKGIAGFLTDLSKKAVRVAQAGLQHLESAMEKKDTGPLSGWGAVQQASDQHLVMTRSMDFEDEAQGSHRPGGGSGGVRAGPAWVGTATGAAAADEEGAAKALEVAVRIAELPMEVRADALAGLRPELRAMVEEILREQAMLEAEDGGAVAALGSYQQQQQHQQTLVGPTLPDAPRSSYTAAPAAAAVAESQPGLMPAPAEPVRDVEDMDMFFSGAAASSVASNAAAAAGRGSDMGPGAGKAAAAVASAPLAATAPRPTAHGDHQYGDFLSGGSHHETGVAATAGVALPSGLHGFGDFADATTAPEPPTPPAQAAAPAVQTTSSADLGDFFSGGAAAVTASAVPAAPARTPAVASSSRPAAPAAGSSGPRPRTAVDLIGDLHSEGVDVSGHQELYNDEEGEEGEPEIRRQLRAARLAERNAKMRAALAEKLAKDQEEARAKEQQVQLKDQHKVAILLWKKNHNNNIRGLLGSLQTVLWENSGWAPVSVGDLLESNQVKRVYMKANLLVHPDKVRQRNGTAEQVAIADMVFDVLKEAWNNFKP